MHQSTKTIKICLLERGVTIEQLAKKFRCRRQELSMLINRTPHREYPELKKKLARFVGKPVEELFGDKPARRRISPTA